MNFRGRAESNDVLLIHPQVQSVTEEMFHEPEAVLLMVMDRETVRARERS